MKILALIDVAPGAPIEDIRAGLKGELQESWKLFAEGALREAYATQTPSRVVFVLESASLAEAAARLQAFPLIRAGLLTFQTMELRPFVNWSLLFAG